MEWPAIGESARRRMASAQGGEHTIPFGMWRGARVKEVPKEYLRYLCLWDNYKRTQKTLLDSGAQQWLWRSHPETVEAARNYVKTRNMCRKCFRPLVPVGHAAKRTRTGEVASITSNAGETSTQSPRTRSQTKIFAQWLIEKKCRCALQPFQPLQS